MRRCGQTNFNERDPQDLDVDWWIDYWRRLRVDTLMLNGGGIMAFYPTAVPNHVRSRYLDGRDLFGEYVAAAKRAGMRVVARMDCNYVFEEVYRSHPEWIAHDAAGQPVRHSEYPGLFQTCMFSTYFTEQMPSIYREISALYDVDGFYTNGWPSTTRRPTAFAMDHRDLAKLPTREFHRVFEDRVLAIWKLWDDVAKEARPDGIYVGNLGGSIHATTDIMAIAKVAGWFNADHQGRSGTTPVWDCAQQGRVARSVMEGRLVTNVTGAYANSNPYWRHTSKAAEETTLWLAQSVASGMVPWLTWLGGKPEDRRWQTTCEAFFKWHSANEEHLVDGQRRADIGVLFSQRTNAYYRPHGAGDVTDYLQGWYYALLEGRFAFDLVHEQALSPETLARYAVLILPNAAMLSDAQCAALVAYVEAGGSIVATFETGCYDEWGAKRDSPALAELFGVTVSGEVIGATGSREHANYARSHFARIEGEHPLLAGFSNVEVLPAGEFRLPVTPGNSDILSVIEPYPAFPPEMVYTDAPNTNEPAVTVRDHGQGRVIWISSDVDRSFWRSTNNDLGRLMRNAVSLCLRGRAALQVEGNGLVELFCWRTRPGYAVHVLNYTSPNALAGWVRETTPLGPQAITLRLAEGEFVHAVRALRSGMDLPFSQVQGVATFTLPVVGDYEVAAVVLEQP